MSSETPKPQSACTLDYPLLVKLTSAPAEAEIFNDSPLVTVTVAPVPTSLPFNVALPLVIVACKSSDESMRVNLQLTLTLKNKGFEIDCGTPGMKSYDLV
jgi:hypothetical protein